MALEKGTHPDLRSTSYPDKSQEAAVLDDRLSRCPPRHRLPTTRSRGGNVALHLPLKPINTARSVDAHMQPAADGRRFRLKPIWPILSRGGWTDLWMPAPLACFTLSQRQGAKFTSFGKRSLPHVCTGRSRERLAGLKMLLIMRIVFRGRTSRLIQSCIAISRQINVARICSNPGPSPLNTD